MLHPDPKHAGKIKKGRPAKHVKAAPAESVFTSLPLRPGEVCGGQATSFYYWKCFVISVLNNYSLGIVA